MYGLLMVLFVPFMMGVSKPKKTILQPKVVTKKKPTKTKMGEFFISDELSALKPTKKKFIFWKGRKRG